MAVKSDQLLVLSRAIAQRIDPRLEVQSAMATDGGAGRAEVLVTLVGCHSDACALSFNVDRSNESVAQQEITDKLLRALADHLT